MLEHGEYFKFAAKRWRLIVIFFTCIPITDVDKREKKKRGGMQRHEKRGLEKMMRHDMRRNKSTYHVVS